MNIVLTLGGDEGEGNAYLDLIIDGQNAALTHICSNGEVILSNGA